MAFDPNELLSYQPEQKTAVAEPQSSFDPNELLSYQPPEVEQPQVNKPAFDPNELLNYKPEQPTYGGKESDALRATQVATIRPLGVTARPQDFRGRVQELRRQYVAAPEGSPEAQQAKTQFERAVPMLNEGYDLAAKTAEAQEQAIKTPYLEARGLLSGATFGLSDIAMRNIEKKYFGGKIDAETTAQMLGEGGGKLIGGFLTGKQLTGFLGPKFNPETVKGMLSLRLGAAAIQGGTNAISSIFSGDRTAKDAAGDFGQNLGAAVVNAISGNVLPRGAMNFITQVGSDLLYDISTDKFLRGRLTDDNWKEWFLQTELPQLVGSLVFAARDVTDKNFNATRQRVLSDLKNTLRRDSRNIPTSTAQPRPPTTPTEKGVPEMAKAVSAETTKQGAVEPSVSRQELESRTVFDLRKEAIDKGLVQKGESVGKSELINRLENPSEQPQKPVRGFPKPSPTEDFSVTMRRKEAESMQKIKANRDTVFDNIEKWFTKVSGPAERALLKLDKTEGSVGVRKGNIKDFLLGKLRRNEGIGAQAVDNLTLARGASAQALRRAESARTKIFGNSIKSNADLTELGDYLAAKRQVELETLPSTQQKRMEMGEDFMMKSPATIEQAQKKILDIESNPQKANIVESAQRFNRHMSENLDILVQEGLMRPDVAEQLKRDQPNYTPRQFMEYLDPMVEGTGSKVSTRESGLKALDTGSEDALLTNPLSLLNQVEASTTARIFKNRANKNLLDIARTMPDNTIGLRVEESSGVDRYGNNIYGELPKGMERIYAWENGERYSILAPKKFNSSWVLSNPGLSSDVAQFFRVLSGTPILKATATGTLAPEFAALNTMRDAVHAYLTTQLYSPVLPLGMAQMTKDYVQVASNRGLRKQLTDIYFKNGGGMEWLASNKSPEQAIKTSIEKGIVDKTGQAIGKLNEASELWTRLALLNRGLKRGLSERAATYEARHYMDFAEGGQVSKAIDTQVPYFNAGIVGTRGILRTFKTDPAGATLKTAQILGASAALAGTVIKHYRPFWDSLPDREKESKWIIPLPFTETADAQGNRQWRYIAIPKDQGQRAISAIGEFFTEGWSTGKYPWKRLGMALSELSPTDITPMPPTLKAVIAYVGNVNPWTWEKVSDLKGRVKPSAEYKTTTPEAWRKIGSVTGMSPERLRTATGQIMADNLFTHLIGGGVEASLTGKINTKERKSIADWLTSTPFVRRVLRQTRPYVMNERQIKEAKEYNIPLKYADGTMRPGNVVMDELQEAKMEAQTARHENTVAGKANPSTRQPTIQFRTGIK